MILSLIVFEMAQMSLMLTMNMIVHPIILEQHQQMDNPLPFKL